MSGTTGLPFQSPSPPAPTAPSPFAPVREFLHQGRYGSTVPPACRVAFDNSVRAYGLVVPVGCTDPQFLLGFLRADMGNLTELLPEPYRLYERVRFGTLETGDAPSLQNLLQRSEAETPLGRIQDPQFRPRGPEEVGPSPPVRPTFSVRRSTTHRGGTLRVRRQNRHRAVHVARAGHPPRDRGTRGDRLAPLEPTRRRSGERERRTTTNGLWGTARVPRTRASAAPSRGRTVRGGRAPVHATCAFRRSAVNRGSDRTWAMSGSNLQYRG